jgi:glycosyltransferase involved in cell wall biosynthesis
MKIAANGAPQGIGAPLLARTAEASEAPRAGTATRPVLLCLSHLRWDFVFQRPQHLVTRAARDHTVLFFEEPVYRPSIAPCLERRRIDAGAPGGLTVLVPVLPEGMPPAEASAAQRRLLDQALAAEGAARELILWFYTPMALDFAAHLAPALTVYDCMDELSAFRGAPPRMLELEQALLGRADLVFTGGRSLFEAKRHRHTQVSCFPSSIDAAHFRAARSPQPDPADQAGIAHPRIGFFGVVDERMDLDLVAALAAARPEWQFVMLGPLAKIDPASLPRPANIHWLGGKGYPELPRYLAGWDAGFMPFARNESTRFISPTKTPEFLAAGLPVVSTPITDVVRDWGEGGFVEIAADAAGFAAALDRMLARPRTGWLQQVDRKLALQSWDRTWSDMQAIMREVPHAADLPAASVARGGARLAMPVRPAPRVSVPAARNPQHA